jgi:hypothetical protein
MSTGRVGWAEGAVVGTVRVSGGGGRGFCDTCVLDTHGHLFVGGGVVQRVLHRGGGVWVTQLVLHPGRVVVVVQFVRHPEVVVLCVDGVVVGWETGFFGGFGGTQVRPASR